MHPRGKTIMIQGEITPEDPDYEVIAPISRAFGKATDAAWLRMRDCDFDQIVNEYKRIEVDFVAQVSFNDFYVLETKRRITEIIFQEAMRKEQPFAICQQWWDDLLPLGFSDMERKCTMIWFYADCCLCFDQFQAGLEVLEPLIAEVEQSLAEPEVAEHAVRFFRKQLGLLQELRDELKAGIRE